jgi:hypothetical protein
MDGLVTAMVVATMATWPAAATVVVAVVVASTAVAVVMVVADTGNLPGVDQNEAAADFNPAAAFRCK